MRRTLTATGSDIYGQPGVTREIYSLYARVEPGNSGGPLLAPTGEVVGVVFAKSLDDPTTGYALTLNEARPVLDAAAGASQAGLHRRLLHRLTPRQDQPRPRPTDRQLLRHVCHVAAV